MTNLSKILSLENVQLDLEVSSKRCAPRWRPIRTRARSTSASSTGSRACKRWAEPNPTMLQTPLTIQRLYDDNRDSLQLGWFAGFPGGERLISGDAVSAADQVGHLNLIHPGRIQVFGHQELNYYQRLRSGSRSHMIGEMIAGCTQALIIDS